MSQPIIPRDEVARRLSVPVSVLARYEALGLVRGEGEGPGRGYPPAEVRRIWSIVTYQRDLGVNLAGVEVILRLREQMADVHRRLHAAVSDLIAALDEPPPADTDA